MAQRRSHTLTWKGVPPRSNAGRRRVLPDAYARSAAAARASDAGCAADEEWNLSSAPARMRRPSAGSREALAAVIDAPGMGKIEAMPLGVAATANVANLVCTVVTSIRVLARADGPLERLRFISSLLSGI